MFLEQLVLSDYKNVKNGWEKDYDKLVIPLIEDDQPCYILYRFLAKLIANTEMFIYFFTL